MIHQLDEKTIHQIAAGEIIERPLSVVKELVENAIDAGADRIEVAIRDGGKESISVSDNGSGIPPNEMEIAFLPHATSKIGGFDDLYRLSTLGFRGEALASIVAVAEVQARSKIANEETGIELTYQGGKLIDRQKVAMSKGTTIVVQHLFAQVPVRKKFMKKEVTEANAIARLMERFAVSHPTIGFSYIRDDRRVIQTAADQGLDETLLLLFGRSYADAMLSLQGENAQYRLEGRIGGNTFYRTNRQMQFLCVNGRAIDPEVIRESVESCYRSVIPNGRFPAFQLFLTTDPQNIDVNVHPNKLQLHFDGLSELQELIRTTVTKTLQHRILPTAEPSETKLFQDFSTEESYRHILQTYAFPKNATDSVARETKDPWSAKPVEPLTFHEEVDFEGETSSPDFDRQEDREEGFINIRSQDAETQSVKIEEKHPLLSASEQLSYRETSSSPLPPLSELRYLGTLFRVYGIFEKMGSDRFYLMDQHAAHERVNYERFLQQMRTGKIVQQSLLQPVVLPLNTEQEDVFEKQLPVLQKAGFDVSIFGDHKVVLRAVPTLFKTQKDEEVFYDLLDLPITDWKDYDHLLDQIAMRACKASVKQGDSLSTSEMLALYEQLVQCAEPLACPHGRPTVIERSKQDLEKAFLRIK